MSRTGKSTKTGLVIGRDWGKEGDFPWQWNPFLGRSRVLCNQTEGTVTWHAWCTKCLELFFIFV